MSVSEKTVPDQISPELEGLRRRCTELEAELAGLKQELKVDRALSELFSPLAKPGLSLEEIADLILDRAKLLTDSAHGYVSAIDPARGDNVGYTLTKMTDQCRLEGETRRIVFPRGPDGRYGGLWGLALDTRQGFYTNAPQDHPAAKGLPPGHVPVDRFLSVPVTLNQELVGQIALANPGRDYNDRDLEAVGRLAGFHALAIQKMRSEEALRESEERCRLLLRNINDAVFVHEVFSVGPGRLLEVNDRASAMLGYTREELLDMTIAGIDAPENMIKIPGIIEELYKHHRVVFQSEHLAKDGRRIPVEVSIGLINRQGKPTALAVVRDITERRRAEEETARLQAQLFQSQKMESVGRLAGGVAHDFNNMLQAILGYTQLALLEVDAFDPLYSKLKEIQQAAERSANLTRQLLAFARKQTVQPEVLNLNRVVSSMQKMLRRIIGEDIELIWAPAEDLWPVEMDPSQVDQILANLMVNARDAIPGVGTITLETANVVLDDGYRAGRPYVLPGEYVILAVSDTGMGMDQETLSHVFEPFFTTKGEGKGTGLGLAMVYGIVKQNNGFTHAYSEVGQGTTLKIYLPRFKGLGSPERPAGRFPEGLLAGTETILIVEDEKQILDVGRAILEMYGYRVLAAQSPGEALVLAEKHEGDLHLLVTDVVMPIMNGRELKERLEKIKPGVKCLFMSGYTANVVVHRGVLSEGFNFIQKPFSIKELAQKVRQTLDG
ncbi:MAG: PAS domain S-box protein [Thermodesulfobacteriota bacterium]